MIEINVEIYAYLLEIYAHLMDSKIGKSAILSARNIEKEEERRTHRQRLHQAREGADLSGESLLKAIPQDL
jgi:hypothetical protein